MTGAQKKTILVVEDEAIVAENIRTTLEQYGYGVSAMVFSGQEAVETAAEKKPDLILMDIRLPGPIDGIEAAQQIRQQFDIPIVYLTAFTDKDTLKRAKITEPFGYIVKPFNEKELHSTVEIAL